ncbi:TetR family transcriptional regulator [Modestobacter sp. NPDC049651]|uniref:TetR family transcriptional regulator n=1 Tax=unclassified Modestobacter TaxID=2643866 RepID=UPI0033CB4026
MLTAPDPPGLPEEDAIDGLRDRKRAHSRAATLDAALALFAERGYDAVTVADICAAAQIAPRTFFRYFPTKDDLLTEPVREMNEHLAGLVAGTDAGADDADVLRAALRDLGGYVLAHRDRLTPVFRAIGQVSAVRSSPVLMLSVQERLLAERLAARRGGPQPPDWRTRLLVARAVAAFRIWLDDAMGADRGFADADHPDPVAHLDEVLAAI